MPYPILLSTLNARYHHSSFGLRYLYANLAELQSQAKILEFTIAQNPRDIAEAILLERPKIVGFGVYIWNTQLTEQVIAILKKVQPGLILILGGPEVSHEAEPQRITQLADYIIQGEADLAFSSLCKTIMNGGHPSQKLIRAQLPPIEQIQLPYHCYSEEDIKNRIIYVEASRGCPYRCEYCLSSLDQSVRNFNLDAFLTSMNQLIERGARSFKFVDRTFNLSIATSTRILNFFLERAHLGLFLHFEMVPDRLPIELRELIQKFPPGVLQFEIGIQTWNPEVAKNVSRRQNYEKITENFKFLNEKTGVHLHTDLIAGLPGESLESFAHGFDAVAALGSQEIQVGILKRLKGTPIIRHDREWEMIYQDHPPFQVLRTKNLTFQELQKLGRFSHFWDQIANSGNFTGTVEFLKEKCRTEESSFFQEFMRLSEFLSNRHPLGHGVALLNLLESLWIFFTQEQCLAPERVRSLLINDYSGKVKRDIPRFLRDNAALTSATERTKKPRSELPADGFKPSPALPKRQTKHWSGVSSTNQ